MDEKHTHTYIYIEKKRALSQLKRLSLALSFIGCENTARIFSFTESQFNHQQNGWDHTLFIIL